MPGPVIDPNQNPSVEKRFGYFMDTQDGHIKLYWKCDEDDYTDLNLQSRYFTHYTNVKSKTRFSITISKNDLIKALKKADIQFVESQLEDLEIEFHQVESDLIDKPMIEGLISSCKSLFKEKMEKYKAYNDDDKSKIKVKAKRIEEMKID